MADLAPAPVEAATVRPSYAATIVARCTRNGVTSWQNVANILGMNAETAKALHGPVEPRSEDEPPEPPKPAVRRR